MSAAALDIPKFVPKVDLQADYNTAKVRGSPQEFGTGGGSTGKGVWHRGRPALPICMFQGVLGAGYQALWLARVLLDGQALMLRGSHWVL